MTTSFAEAEALDLTSLSPGSVVDIETKRRHYHIECLGGTEIRISGHPEYCPTPVPAHLGSINKEGLLDFGMIERNRRLIFVLDDQRPVTTSKVVSVHVEEAKPAPANSTIH